MILFAFCFQTLLNLAAFSTSIFAIANGRVYFFIIICEYLQCVLINQTLVLETQQRKSKI